MNKTNLLKIGILSIAIGATQYAFAIHKYYKKMEKDDQIKLQKACDLIHSENARVAIFETAEKFAQTIQELKNKYPELEFTNPCAE